ncbi:MAG: hypothetical protein QQN63_14705, partial [Nitrosopumilus sp.]
MKIVIPSHKRSHIMSTWKNLPRKLQEKTTIAVYPEEVDDYNHFPLLILPDGLRGIHNKRNFILQSCQEDKLMILDDDLVFAKRREDEPTKFRPCDDIDVEQMYEIAELVLNHYAHGAIATREGGNRNIDDYKFNTRALRAHIFRVDRLQEEGFTLNGTKFMSD